MRALLMYTGNDNHFDLSLATVVYNYYTCTQILKYVWLRKMCDVVRVCTDTHQRIGIEQLIKVCS